MSKHLKFADGLPELILSGKKTATWRINDKRDIVKGDMLSLCYNDGKEFAKAKATEVKEIAFEDMRERETRRGMKNTDQKKKCIRHLKNTIT